MLTPMEQIINYTEIGLIVGLEVHQQLLTQHKLFCRCPSGLYTKDHDAVILRHMRPTLSELGEYDGTALMEFKSKKNIVYLLHKDNVCTYEMDDTPPFLMNQKALDVAIEQCLMLGCDIIDEVHVARKQYLDGSIPTGFQRTAIVGVNGRLPFLGRELSITQVSIEEDSCREISDRGHLIVWRTDRLGIPLIETVTGPDLRTPDEVVEAILLIGRVCRTTGHVRVGLGASRQDINVSVRGGRRVEIKGVPQAWWARRLVHNEAIRQVNLLRLRDELHKRGFRTADDLIIKHTDVTSLFKTSQLAFLCLESWNRYIAEENRRPGIELGKGPFCVRAVKLTGLINTLNWPTQPDHSFAHELTGRIRVIAGLDQKPILIHNEKWPDYEGSQGDLLRLKEKIGCSSNDSVVIIWGPLDDTLTAAEEIRIRYLDAINGVPNETRQPFVDGSTDFERILPGPDRMYPDTDSPPISIMRERVNKLRAELPPPPWKREKLYSTAGVPRNTIHFLIRRGDAAIVDEVVNMCGADLRQTCFFFGEWLKGMRRDGVAVVLWEARKQLVSLIAEAPEKPIERIVQETGLKEEPSEWEKLVNKIVDNNQLGPNNRSYEKQFRFYMGQIMSELRGRVPAGSVITVLQEKLHK